MGDIGVWRTLVTQTVSGIADAGLQRRAWFGLGPELSSPTEEFNQFFDNALVKEFIHREDAGLSSMQKAAGLYLVELMEALTDQTPQHIDPSHLIDDPRWVKIREAASQFSALLAADSDK